MEWEKRKEEKSRSKLTVVGGFQDNNLNEAQQSIYRFR
jgi:hypothetical protein